MVEPLRGTSLKKGHVREPCALGMREVMQKDGKPLDL